METTLTLTLTCAATASWWSLPVKVAASGPGAALMWQVTVPSAGAEEMVKGCHSCGPRAGMFR